MIFNFEDKDILELQKKFLKNGYIISNFRDKRNIKRIQEIIVNIIKKKLKLDNIKNPEVFLNNFHKNIKLNQLNNFRIKLYENLNSKSWFRPLYYNLIKKTLDSLVGNELAMQNMINLSIQLPKDNTSLIDTHSDIFTGETPFQVVVWLPLVNVYKTKSMFINNIYNRDNFIW